MTRKRRIRIVAGILIACRISNAFAAVAPLLCRVGRDAAVAMLSTFMGVISAHAALITFNDAIVGQTVYNFDANSDGIVDFRFSTTDPSGFRTAGPGTNMNFIQEPGLEGTSLLPVDLRVDFISGTNSLKFGFALDSSSTTGTASVTAYDRNNAVIGSQSVAGQFTPTPLGQSSFPEGQVNLSFAKTAAYATMNFTSDFGRYIIDNVSIAAVPQTVYLNFDANANAVFAAADAAKYGVQPGTIYSKPAASLGTGSVLGSADITSILDKERSIYSPYLVDFTATKPSSGDYSTIYVGGTTIPGSTINVPTESKAGISQMRDYGNHNKNDSAVVFSGLSFFNNSIDSLAQVIAHETGHLLGLAHLTDSGQLMYPRAPAQTDAPNRIAIGGPTPVAADGSLSPISPPISQDSNGLLNCYVGSRSLVDYVCTQSAIDSLQQLTLRQVGYSLVSTIYDAKLVIPSGDDDSGATVIDLGTLTPGQGTNFAIPRIPALQGFIQGASVAGGPVDIFSGSPSGISGDPADYGTFVQLLTDSDGNLNIDNLALYQLVGGNFNRDGQISLSPQQAPEPGSLWLMSWALAWLLFCHGCAKARRRSLHIGR